MSQTEEIISYVQYNIPIQKNMGHTKHTFLAMLRDMLLLINHSFMDKFGTAQFLYIIITSALPCCTVKTIIDTGSPFPTPVLALTVML